MEYNRTRLPLYYAKEFPSLKQRITSGNPVAALPRLAAHTAMLASETQAKVTYVAADRLVSAGQLAGQDDLNQIDNGLKTSP